MNNEQLTKRQFMSTEHFPVAYLGAALYGRDFPMSLGEQVRDFIDVRDVAKAFLSALFLAIPSPALPAPAAWAPVKRKPCASSLNTGGGTGEHPVNCVTALYPTARMNRSEFYPR